MSSFANTRGGDLLIGVSESGGVPKSLVPFDGDIDAELRRLDSMARSGLEPRIPNLRILPVPIASGGAVLAIRIPRSYRLPHRVIFAGLNRFYARSAAGKYEPSVDELRALFTLAPELAERMRAFRFDRAASIAARDTPVPLMSESCLVLHVVPFSHFDLAPALRLQSVIENRNSVIPLGTRSPSALAKDGARTVAWRLSSVPSHPRQPPPDRDERGITDERAEDGGVGRRDRPADPGGQCSAGEPARQGQRGMTR